MSCVVVYYTYTKTQLLISSQLKSFSDLMINPVWIHVKMDNRGFLPNLFQTKSVQIQRQGWAVWQATSSLI